jgi:hypothetical protein
LPARAVIVLDFAPRTGPRLDIREGGLVTEGNSRLVAIHHPKESAIAALDKQTVVSQIERGKKGRGHAPTL